MHLNYELFRANALVNHIKPYVDNGSTVLDFGCGDGVFTDALYRNFSINYKQPLLYGYDIRDLRHARIRESQSFHFISSLSDLKAQSVDACLVIDVVHHIRVLGDTLLGLQNVLVPAVKLLKTGGFLIVKDYVIDGAQPFGWLQKLVLFTKDVTGNPRQMSKGFNYLNRGDWRLLWAGLKIKTAISKPFYYLPAEKYYARITGRAWFWVLKKT